MKLFTLRIAATTAATVIAATLSTSAIAQSATTPSSASAATSTGLVSHGDKMFLVNAAQGGLFEIKASKLAKTRGNDAEVKSIAKMMVTDHTATNAKLKALAVRERVPVITKLDAEHQTNLQKLQATRSGRDFDSAYVDTMVASHESVVALFDAASSASEDSEVTSFAKETLPKLKEHLTKIQAIKAKMSP